MKKEQSGVFYKLWISYFLTSLEIYPCIPFLFYYNSNIINFLKEKTTSQPFSNIYTSNSSTWRRVHTLLEAVVTTAFHSLYLTIPIKHTLICIRHTGSGWWLKLRWTRPWSRFYCRIKYLRSKLEKKKERQILFSK